MEKNFLEDVSIDFLLHDLKEPIWVIETGVKMLLYKQSKYGSITSKQEKILLRILKNSKKTMSMLNSLLEIGRAESNVFYPCIFNPVQAAYDALLETVQIYMLELYDNAELADKKDKFINYMSEKGIFLKSSDEAETAKMFQDSRIFYRIIGNLFNNALNYRKTEVYIDMSISKEKFIVDIADNGPGIELADKKVLFEKYVRGKEKDIYKAGGHGLGLAGARILARYLGGDITVKSEKGKGCCFSVSIPLKIK